MKNTIVKYKNPPLVEAVFEMFYFSKNWNPATVGLFYNEIKQEFGHISKMNPGVGFQLNGGQVSFGGTQEITQFRNNEQDIVIQLSSNLLTINKLPPYKSWDTFFEIIQNIYKKFEKVLEDFEIKRLGLKFLNKVNIGTEHSYINFKKHFEIFPNVPIECEENLKTISMLLEYPINEKKEIIALTFNTLMPEVNMNAPVLFELYAVRTSDFEIDIFDWISFSHKELRNKFEKSIKEEIKQIFKK